MAEKLVFYTNPMSRGRMVRWMLEEIGQPYQTEILEYGESLKSPEFRAINPMGKVPALVHGSAVITECAAICAYLADAFPQAGLAPPPTDALRAPYYRWLFFAAGPFESALTNRAMKFELPPGRERSAGYGSFADAVNTLESAVSGRTYLVGDTFTAADVYVGSQIGNCMMFGLMEKRPAFETYFAGISQRPAAVRAREIDDALIKK